MKKLSFSATLLLVCGGLFAQTIGNKELNEI